jgi:drug/metabolite transporter (DMT)-like permease
MLLDSRHSVGMTGRTYLRAVVPIGVLYSGSLVCSNLVYLYLSVAFIQMLKAAAPVAVLFASWAWGLKEPSWHAFLNIAVIVSGVVLASLGEVEFGWLGFVFQVGGIVFEAVRVVMVEVLLKGEGEGELGRMDPLVSLYYYAPVCAAMNCVVALLTEASTFNVSDIFNTGLLVLILNAAVAFMLNVSSVFLVRICLPVIGIIVPSLTSITLIDRQDLGPRAHPDRHPQERAPHLCLGPHLAHSHHRPAVDRLPPRHRWSARLLRDGQVGSYR